jgi:hypothetical protein
MTYSSEAVCVNLDNVTRYVTIVDQGAATRGQIAVPATGALTYLTGTFNPVSSITSLEVMLDGTTVANQLVCYMARVNVRQQYASKTRIYIPLASLQYNYNSNVDVNNANPLVATSTPVALNTGATSTTMTNPERTHRFNFTSTNYGNTIVAYSLEAVCSASAANKGLAELYNITGAADVTSSKTANCPLNVLGLVTSSWTADAKWISGNDYEVRVMRSAAGSNEWLYKGGLWIQISNLQKALVMYRVGKYSSDTTATTHPEVSAIINSSYFNGITNGRQLFFEASGRDPVAGTSDLELYDYNSSTSILNGLDNFTTTVKARLREATSLNITDGDQYTTYSNVTTGTQENSGTFVIIQPQ